MAEQLRLLSVTGIQSLGLAACRQLLRSIGMRCPRTLEGCRSWLIDIAIRMQASAPPGDSPQIRDVAHTTVLHFFKAHPDFWEALLVMEAVNIDKLLDAINTWISSRCEEIPTASSIARNSDMDVSDILMIDDDDDDDGDLEGEEKPTATLIASSQTAADKDDDDRSASAAATSTSSSSGSDVSSSEDIGHSMTANLGHSTAFGTARPHPPKRSRQSLSGRASCVVGLLQPLTKPQLRKVLELQGVLFSDPWRQ